MRSGETIPADLIVLSTGYRTQDELVRETVRRGGCGARRADLGLRRGRRKSATPTWRRRSPGLWFIGGSFAQCRIYSKYLALQIKAREAGLIR